MNDTKYTTEISYNTVQFEYLHIMEHTRTNIASNQLIFVKVTMKYLEYTLNQIKKMLRIKSLGI